MAKVWSEIEIAAAENRCELVLTGQEISQRLDRDGLDCALFTLSKLNYLEISRTSLSLVPDGLYNLSNLSKLSLHSNKLSSVPSSLGRLTLLKHLDLSRNQINSLPEEIDHLVQLHDLNVSSNRLVHLPPIPHLVKLVALDISHNQFDEFPASLLNGGLDHLAEIRARGNVITAIPSRLCRLPSLKTLDIEDNKVQTVAGELGDAAKLKEIFLKGNPLSDRRLLKTVEQCHHKQVIDYIRNHCPRDASEENDGEQSKTKSKKKKNKTGTAAINSDIDMITDGMRIMVLSVKGDTPKVVAQDAVKDVRPYIVCCILKDLDFQVEGKFKQFITLQTRLHDNECQKRNLATIATHDLSKVVGDIVYDAQPPTEISITPLSRSKPVTARGLFEQLKKEAENIRKEKKRSAYSGIHKYLHLLEEKPVFPCLLNGNGRVMSLPPLTNSDETKITLDTKNILVEVTSSVNLKSCKEVLDALIRETAKLQLYAEDDKKSSEEDFKCNMVIQQVRVVDKEGHLRVVYPAHPDLQFDDLRIIHEAKKA